MSGHPAIVDRLRAAGLRPTRQRLTLGALLFGSGIDRHVTAEELHAEAAARGARVSLATVYNALNQFTAAGLLREVLVGPGRLYFDTNVGDHHHFYIEDDGTLLDIPADRVTITQLPDAPAGMNVERVDVVVRVRR
ncbi:iron response transcriptional regulator IrrA [Vineibacter terrae]|uniref:iron response transcriptional regulator IrrA n=1 Tax=Vineibacter terrae TaxID=2586908 RepID=UPI002E340860|nr:transcriptional repressor [Vineibacter terrae]HEX2888675.1 transcriptional repressor [Vineibacter terrae]